VVSDIYVVGKEFCRLEPIDRVRERLEELARRGVIEKVREKLKVARCTKWGRRVCLRWRVSEVIGEVYKLSSREAEELTYPDVLYVCRFRDGREEVFELRGVEPPHEVGAVMYHADENCIGRGGVVELIVIGDKVGRTLSGLKLNEAMMLADIQNYPVTVCTLHKRDNILDAQCVTAPRVERFFEVREVEYRVGDIPIRVKVVKYEPKGMRLVTALGKIAVQAYLNALKRWREEEEKKLDEKGIRVNGKFKGYVRPEKFVEYLYDEFHKIMNLPARKRLRKRLAYSRHYIVC